MVPMAFSKRLCYHTDMRIVEVFVSVFELREPSPLFQLVRRKGKWVRKRGPAGVAEWHVMHVRTDQGIEGVCTVGDVRYTQIHRKHLKQLRDLAIGSDPLDRDGLRQKLEFATRIMYTPLGWQGAFDNCLWDIAGKAAEKPVCDLIGKGRESVPSYYNFESGGSLEDALNDAQHAIALGFGSLKDHFAQPARENVVRFEAFRRELGPEIGLMHDAAVAQYDYREAELVGNVLAELGYDWFEEPLPDQNLQQLISLSGSIEVPVLVGETMMHDHRLLRSWLDAGAMDKVRANARHGTTPLLDLAGAAARRGRTIELNGPGGLFGLVHANLLCTLDNVGPYEYFPGGLRDELGREIGMQNPPIPVDGKVSPPDRPGWGAEWDWPYFEKRRLAVI